MYLLNYIKKNIERRRQEKKFKEELIKKLSQDPKVVKAGNDYLEAREKLLKRVKGELTLELLQ